MSKETINFVPQTNLKSAQKIYKCEKHGEHNLIMILQPNPALPNETVGFCMMCITELFKANDIHPMQQFYKLMDINEFNAIKKQRKIQFPTYPLLNGLECPMCGSELCDEDGKFLDIEKDEHPKTSVTCSSKDCDYKSSRLL